MRGSQQPGQSSQKWLLAAGTLIASLGNMGFISLVIVVPFATANLGSSLIAVSLILPMVYLGTAILSPRCGKWADRYGAVRVTAGGLVLAGLGLVLSAGASGYSLFLGGALVIGFGYAGIAAGTSVLVFPDTERRRGLIMGIKQSGFPIGGFLAGVVIPWISVATSWRVALLVVVGMEAVAAALVCLLLREPRRDRLAQSRKSAQQYCLRPMPGNLFGFFMAAAQITVMGMLVIYLTAWGLDPTVAALSLSLSLGLAVAMRVAWGFISDLQPRNRSIPLLVSGCIGVLGVAFLVLPYQGVIVIALCLIGAGTFAWNGAFLTAAMSSAPGREGWAAGSALQYMSAGCIVGPPVGALLLQLPIGWAATWFVTASLQVIAVIAAAAATRAGAVVCPSLTTPEESNVN